MAAVLNGRIRLVGSDCYGRWRTPETHVIFDPAAGAWTSSELVPGAARSWTGAAALDGMVCLVPGSWDDERGAGGSGNDQDHDPGVAALDGRVHVVGGERVDGSPPSQVLHHAWTPDAVLQVSRKD